LIPEVMRKYGLGPLTYSSSHRSTPMLSDSAVYRIWSISSWLLAYLFDTRLSCPYRTNGTESVKRCLGTDAVG
jgi:hypothetical protein